MAAGTNESLLDVALGYISRGWNPLPVPYRAKKPTEEEWQLRTIDANNAARFFNGAQMNIGVVLGISSGGLTDVDLDAAEAVAIGPYLLPKTAAIFGRPSKRASHWLYYTDLAVTADKAVFGFNDPTTKERLLELRIGGGGKGAQTIFPGSTHKETGEPIAWEDTGEPASVNDDDLSRRANTLAAYALLARYWPKRAGGRHECALVLGGFLARAGKSAAETKLAAEAIARAAGDEEWRDRRKAAEDAATAHHNGERAFGLPTLRQQFGDRIAGQIADWLGYRDADRTESEPVAHNAKLVTARASTFEMTAFDWLWKDRFAIGKLSLIVGLPDEGKGQLLSNIAALVTTAGLWPCDEGRAPLGNVLMFTDEDDPHDTVVPRLAAADADLDRIEIVRMVHDNNKDRLFNLVTDLELLRRKILELGDNKLIIIDPISAYLGVGKINSFRTTDVRAVLAPLVNLAAELHVAIIAVMHFNKKIDVTNALLRISDSLAFGAVARGIYAVIDDEEHERKLLVRAKNNIAAKTNKTLAFRFTAREVGVDKQNGKAIWAPYIVWDPQYVDVSATEAMQAAADNKSPAARNEARNFLSDMLAGGPMLKTEIEEAADANGITERTLRRAKAELKITAKKDGEDQKWRWHLPEPPATYGKDL